MLWEFLLPLDLYAELEQLINSFWLGKARNDCRGIHWMSWDHMCGKKNNGMMGFRKLHDFNLALLGKQAWRFLIKLNLLVSRIYRAPFFS